jgi:hypothetical protein
MVPDQIVFPVGIQLRQFRGFAADQHAVVFGAGLAQALDELGHRALVNLAHADVVEEEQRARALHQDVVDAVVDDVLAHRVVTPGPHRHLELGAHAVRAADQQVLLAGRLEQPAEGAPLADHVGVLGLLDEFLGPRQRRHLGVNINAALAIGRILFHNVQPQMDTAWTLM